MSRSGDPGTHWRKSATGLMHDFPFETLAKEFLAEVGASRAAV